MTVWNPDTEELIDRALRGEDRPRQELLIRHYERLIRMVAVRLDRRLAARVDPADIVREALLEASQNLLEQLSTAEAAEVLGISESALKKRHLRTGTVA